MTKFVIIVVVIYVFYYAGNIIYDLYFKKTKLPNEDENKEEFSIKHITEDDVKNIDIDDVENIETSKSFEIDEEGFVFSSANNDEMPIENENTVVEDKQLVSEEKAESIQDNVSNEVQNEIQPEVNYFDRKEEIRKIKREFKNIIADAQTSIEVVNINGIRTWKSTLANLKHN